MVIASRARCSAAYFRKRRGICRYPQGRRCESRGPMLHAPVQGSGANKGNVMGGCRGISGQLALPLPGSVCLRAAEIAHLVPIELPKSRCHLSDNALAVVCLFTPRNPSARLTFTSLAGGRLALTCPRCSVRVNNILYRPRSDNCPQLRVADRPRLPHCIQRT